MLLKHESTIFFPWEFGLVLTNLDSVVNSNPNRLGLGRQPMGLGLRIKIYGFFSRNYYQIYVGFPTESPGASEIRISSINTTRKNIRHYRLLSEIKLFSI